MRILFVTEFFPPDTIGGAEWSAYYLAKQLASIGHQVTVITPNYADRGINELKDGIDIRRYSLFPLKSKKRTKEAHKINFMNPIFYLITIIHLIRIARKSNPQIIHAHNKYSYVPAAIASIFLNKPLVVTLRDWRTLCNYGMCLMKIPFIESEKCKGIEKLRCFKQWRKEYISHLSTFKRTKSWIGFILKEVNLKFTQWAIKRAIRVITISDAVNRIYSKRGVISKNKSITIYNSFILPSEEELIEPKKIYNKYNIPSGTFILCPGKISKGKGSQLAVDALSLILDQFPDVFLVFAGPIATKLSIDEKFKDKILILGQIPHIELLSLIRIADIVVVPVLWQEPLGRVVIESLMLGKAVIAAESGGIGEIIENGINGLLVPRADVYSLAEAIIKLIKDKELANNLAAQGKRTIHERFGNIILDKHIEVYSNCLKKM